MPNRDHAPIGSPCWVDLWTSDVEGSRRFYNELFGWKAEEASPEFGGYFMFTRNGVPVAGAMGDMGDMPAKNTWKIYLNTDDVENSVRSAEALGAEVLAPIMPVADLGTQAVLIDPTGASLGAWQPGTFPGFTVLGEVGTPSWFELHTRDYVKAVEFYRSVFHWEISSDNDAKAPRYATKREPNGEEESAGIMDASTQLGEGESASWSVYWRVNDAETTVAKVLALGGSIVEGVEGSPHGDLAEVADPAGAHFKLLSL